MSMSILDTEEDKRDGQKNTCDNCGARRKTVDRVDHLVDHHTNESHAKHCELCETCASAFDMGAGNA